MAYATVADVEARAGRTLTGTEQRQAAVLLDDAAVLIDAYKKSASDDAKKTVSCRVVIRALGTGTQDIPTGATNGSMSGLGYSQSWTISGGGAAGEIYLARTDRQILGGGNSIGSGSPIEHLGRAAE